MGKINQKPFFPPITHFKQTTVLVVGSRFYSFVAFSSKLSKFISKRRVHSNENVKLRRFIWVCLCLRLKLGQTYVCWSGKIKVFCSKTKKKICLHSLQSNLYKKKALLCASLYGFYQFVASFLHCLKDPMIIY